MLRSIITTLKIVKESDIADVGYSFKDGKLGLFEILTEEEQRYLVNLFYKYNDDVHPSMVIDNDREEFTYLGETPKTRLLNTLEVLNDLEK